MKKRVMSSCYREVEHASFTSLVHSTPSAAGRMARGNSLLQKVGPLLHHHHVQASLWSLSPHDLPFSTSEYTFKHGRACRTTSEMDGPCDLWVRTRTRPVTSHSLQCSLVKKKEEKNSSSSNSSNTVVVYSYNNTAHSSSNNNSSRICSKRSISGGGSSNSSM